MREGLADLGADVVPAPMQCQVSCVRARPALRRQLERRRERGAVRAARFRAARAALPALPLTTRSSSPGQFVDAIVQTEPFEVMEDGPSTPSVLSARRSVVARKRFKHRRRSAPARGGAEYDADWTALDVQPISFEDKVGLFLTSSELPDYKFSFEVSAAKGVFCYLQCPGMGHGRFRCTQCGVLVCGPCSFTHTQEHFTEHEAAALRDAPDVMVMLEAIHMTCVGFV